jgi:riboflavin kinase / FMN adenylyltransferase
MADGCVLTIGNFDGVHLGHRAILAHARQTADALDLPLRAMTFEPLPMAVLRPDLAPPRLSNSEQRARLLQDAGADQVIVLEPTTELLATSPLDFLKDVCREYKPRAMVEGQGFRFGRDRAGDVETLALHGEKLGYRTQVVTPVETVLEDHSRVTTSSSLIRWLLSQGRVVDAALCLGRTYSLSGEVIAGEKRGRVLGWPTVNLSLGAQPNRMLPADGVYAGVAHLASGRRRDAAISVGVKPTFGDRARVVEAHLLDFEGNLYGQSMTLHIARWLRPQQRFASVDLLKAQLARDVAEVRRLRRADALEPVPSAHTVAATITP